MITQKKLIKPAELPAQKKKNHNRNRNSIIT